MDEQHKGKLKLHGTCIISALTTSERGKRKAERGRLRGCSKCWGNSVISTAPYLGMSRPNMVRGPRKELPLSDAVHVHVHVDLASPFTHTYRHT